MAAYRYSICEPLNPQIIEKGAIEKEHIVGTFEEFPWVDHLEQMEGKEIDDIHYSPSLEFENTATRHGLCFSIVRKETEDEFYVFYKRPATIKSFFGLIKKQVPDHVTDVAGQTREDALKILAAFLNDDHHYLEKIIR